MYKFTYLQKLRDLPFTYTSIIYITYHIRRKFACIKYFVLKVKKISKTNTVLLSNRH